MRNGEDEIENIKKSRILVVDDDVLNLFVAKRILSTRYEVDAVSSGEEAFKHLETKEADLILLDICMPGMDGYTFMELIKKKSDLRDIPIICLTADDDQESEVRCFELGAVDFITKPFVDEIMFQRTSRTLELAYLQKQLRAEVEYKTRKLDKRSRQLKRMTVQVMQTLAGTIDAKDKYTNGHSLRVPDGIMKDMTGKDIRTGLQEKIFRL